VSEPGADEVGVVGQEAAGRQTHRCDSAPQLLDDVFLIAAMVAHVDHLPCGNGHRQVGQHVAVAPLLEEFALLVLIDPLPADDQAVGGLASRRTVGDLGQPLLP